MQQRNKPGETTQERTQSQATALHLPSLNINGYRGIEHLSINRLGRVTLLAGRNGTSKTTVLDAVRIFADCGHISSIIDTLNRCEEIIHHATDDNDRSETLDFETLFYGRKPTLSSELSIGPNGENQRQLCISILETDDIVAETGEPLPSISRRYRFIPDATAGPVLKISFGDFKEFLPVFNDDFRYKSYPYTRRFALNRQRTPRSRLQDVERPDTVPHQSLGPGLLSNQELDRLWGEIVLTPHEPMVIRALQLATHSDIKGVATIPGSARASGRRIVVKLGDNSRVPLRSLGDGAVRMFSTALALANTTGGFLLIDEAENGIHHSIQRDFWNLIFQAAEEHNIQVIATTHSWDCISGFATAAKEHENTEGIAVRLERDNGTLRCIEYPEDELNIATSQGIEVR